MNEQRQGVDSGVQTDSRASETDRASACTQRTHTRQPAIVLQPQTKTATNRTTTIHQFKNQPLSKGR